MHLTGNTSAKQELERIAREDHQVIRFLIRLALTNVNHETFFRARDGNRYALSIDLTTGEIRVAPAYRDEPAKPTIH